MHSIRAMKVEIEILKNGDTNSGTNPAGLQDSESVPGNNPPNKRRRTVSEEANSDEDPKEETFVDL